MPAPTVSIVVPVYNEQETLGFSHQKLTALIHLPEFQTLKELELIYVNDGSRDESAKILNEIARGTSEPRLSIRVLHFARNFGHSSAVLAGLQAASGDVIGIIDVDLQDPPHLLGPMFTELQSGFDVVYGQRTHREAESVFKKLTAWMFYRLLNSMIGLHIPNDTGDFRLMTREVCDALLSCQEQEPFLRGLVAWVGFRQKAFPYKRECRKFGSTKYPFKKMLRFALVAILNFSNFPLRLAIYFGFFSLTLSFCVLFWALATHFSGHTVQGWTSLLVVFLFGQSVTLLITGIIGLYIGQIHSGVQGRPRYIVMNSVQSEPARDSLS